MLDGNLVPEDACAFFLRQLSASEARRYGQFSRRERQRQFLLGRILLRFAVADATGLPPHHISIVERPDNAPQLVFPESDGSLSFSLSHSRNWISCVVSADAMIGVDVEVNDPGRNFIAASQLAFHQNDCLWLLRQPDTERVSAFYRLWSMREALFKLESALGGQSAFLPLIGTDDRIALQGRGWFGYALSHPNLSVVVCSDRLLIELQKIELTSLGPMDWLRGVHSFVTSSSDCLEELHS